MRVPLLFAALSLLAAFPSSEVAAQAGRSAPPPQLVVQPQVLPIGSIRKREHPVGSPICERYAGWWGFSNGGKEYAAVGQTPPVQYVTGTIVFQSPRVPPTASQHMFGWPANYPAYSTLYAQVLAWTSATGGQLVAHSRLVDFQLLLP